MRKPFNYDTIHIGEVLGVREVHITDEMIRTCAQAIESSHPWYFEDSLYGGRIAPPTIFDNDTLRMLDEQYERFGSIHAKQAWEFFYPARLGKKVTLTVRVVDTYVRRKPPLPGHGTGGRGRGWSHTLPQYAYLTDDVTEGISGMHPAHKDLEIKLCPGAGQL